MTIQMIKIVALTIQFICLQVDAYQSLLRDPETPIAYQSCPPIKWNMLNVHLIPHSHNDVGWIKTVDQYYYGDNSDRVSAGVQYILDNVITELEANPNRKFIYVEMSFFWRWWTSRDEAVRQKVYKLVNTGQLEFINGGWSMADEATPYYAELIDQMTHGFYFLNETFGPAATPKIGWSIDTFGHSRETASLFAQMGFDGIFFGRLDYQDHKQRMEKQTMEFVWNASENLGLQSQIFAGILYNGYEAPKGFCFDSHCSDPPIKDHPSLKDFNVDARVNDFVAYVKKQASCYSTNNIMLTMGGDFHYLNAKANFMNMDKLIAYVNDRQSRGSLVNVFYSTPSCYLLSLNKAGKQWTVKTDDFLPYASEPHTYWTGFYTSRASFKGYTKYTHNILQVGKQLCTSANVGEINQANLDTLRRHQGDVQHHDGISGTARQEVTNDYIQSLSYGVITTTNAINSAFAKLISNGTSVPPTQFICDYLNVSHCDFTERLQNFVLTVYNPLAHNIKTSVRVPVGKSIFLVNGPDGAPLDSQTVPIPGSVLQDPERGGPATHDLVFNAELPPNGFKSFFVRTQDHPGAKTSSSVQYAAPSTDAMIKNEHLVVTVDEVTGLLKNIIDIATGKVYYVTQNFYYYQGMAGNNVYPETRASGAYVFRPNGTVKLISPRATVATVLGSEVQEIQQFFSDYVSQVIRLYPGEYCVEMEWMIGPIPVNDSIGKEVITQYTTNFKTDRLFYTDSNGREILHRIRNYRPTWDVSMSELISGNYYPITSRIFIQDTGIDSQLTVITDRSEGGGSMVEGQIEIMLHRRLLHDDGLGLREPLNEPGVDGHGLRVRGKHWLLVSPIAEASKLHRVRALKTSNPPLIFIAPLYTTISDYLKHFETAFSGLKGTLPDNVHLLTLEPWKGNNSVLIRLEHFIEKRDDPGGLSNPVTVNIQRVFTNFEVKSIDETTLGANIWLKDLKKMSWKISNATAPIYSQKAARDPTNITLYPMQIRTFVARVSYY